MSISKEEKRKHQEENLNKKNLEKESQNKNEECSKTAENSQVEQSDIDLKAENDKNKALADEYLNLAKVIQADFENYRKRSLEQIEKAKIDGMVQVVELMLPSLDAFKKAKENIIVLLNEKGLTITELEMDMMIEEVVNSFNQGLYKQEIINS